LLHFSLRAEVADPVQDAGAAPERVVRAERIAFADEGLSDHAVSFGKDLEVRLFARRDCVHDVIRGPRDVAERRARLGPKEVEEPYEGAVASGLSASDSSVSR
jgi:hypothetical protein